MLAQKCLFPCRERIRISDWIVQVISVSKARNAIKSIRCRKFQIAVQFFGGRFQKPTEKEFRPDWNLIGRYREIFDRWTTERPRAHNMALKSCTAKFLWAYRRSKVFRKSLRMSSWHHRVYVQAHAYTNVGKRRIGTFHWDQTWRTHVLQMFLVFECCCVLVRKFPVSPT